MTHSTTYPVPPGNLGLPIIGETLDFFRDSDFQKRRHERYGPIFKTRILGQATVYIQGGEANPLILGDRDRHFEVTWPPSTRALLGANSLALQTGEIHSHRRRLMFQAFQPRALESYIPTMLEISDRYIERWRDRKTLTWYPELRQYTFDVAAKLLVGLDDGSRTDLGHLFETWCGGLFSIPWNFPWTNFGKAKRARRELLALLEDIIHQRQQQPSSNTDALGLLLTAEDENGNRLSLEELKEQILLLLFAGHETLTSSMVSMVMLLAQYPEVRDRAREEQEQFRDRSLTSATLKEMVYLEQVMQEVLRFIPAVGGGFRKVIKALTYGGYQIPVGWNITYQIGSTHRNSDYFTDPDRFDPDRFAPDRAEDKPPFRHIAFGGGMRECLGKEFARLEMKLLAVKLLRDYDWTLLPDQDLSLKVVPTPCPKDGLKVEFVPLARLQNAPAQQRV
ncbi:cytochrome P450 [Baaleninema sp.]|uniref:cytochrome P450 n=1 Tax=Baaleninema sp. TaxID=3101197 RepID=UPI003CFE90DC